MMKSPGIVDSVAKERMKAVGSSQSDATIRSSHEAGTPATAERGAIGVVLNKLGKNTFIYSFSTILSQVIAFAMIPVYTHHLSPSDYGIIELLNLTTYIVAMIIGAGMSAAIIRFYYEYDDIQHRNQMVSTALLFIFSLTAISMLFIQYVRYEISNLVFNNILYASHFQIILFTMHINIVNELALSYIRAKQNTIKYNILSLLRLVSGLSLNIYFIVFLGLGVWGVLYSGLISSMIAATIMLPMTFFEVKVGFSLSKLQELLRYGLPLIPAGLGMFVLNFADRFFLQKYSPLSSVGVYSLGYKFGMIISALILTPFLQFWSAYMHEVAQKGNAKELFAKVHLYISCIMIFFTICLSILSDEVVKLLTPQSYWKATKVIPIITSSYIFIGFHYFFNLGHILKKKTKYIAYCVSCSAVLSIFLNFILVPLYNEQGAAWATFISFVFMALLNFNLSQRVYKIDYEYLRLAKLFIVGIFVVAISKASGKIFQDYGVLLDMIVIVSFPLLLYMINFFVEDEVKAMKRMIILLFGKNNNV